ncbi:MAG: chorismate-binding protein [Corynebacterium sp.]|nr:chorismate-binding protein [Corynebacterium sp.]
MILLIDNYDSFSYNLYHQVFRVTGREPVLIHNDEPVEPYLGPELEAVIISPGPGNPMTPRDMGCSTVAIDYAVRNAVPLLGICLGHQAIAHYFGGEVGRVHPTHGIMEEISYRGRPMQIMRYHSLGVTRLPAPLRPIAWAADGTLMGLEHPTLPILGVQFHPESVGSPTGDEIMREFLGYPLRHEVPAVSPLDVIATMRGRGQEEFFWLRDGEKSIIAFPSTRPAPAIVPGAGFSGTGWVGTCTYEGEATWLPVRNSVIIHGDTMTLVSCDRDFFPEAFSRAACSVPAALRAELAAMELRDDHDSYIEKIAQCQEKIAAGESYEVCLTTAWEGEASSWDVLELAALFNEVAPTPYGACVHAGGRTALSFSPEEFIRIQDGVARSRPIKGTAPAEDSTDFVGTKEIAENLMIVDLVRHDLGRVSVPDGVVADPLLVVETHGHVHQLISTISAQLREDVSPQEVLDAAFPPGSMTGAPKKRTMEIIEELEKAPRGLYSGYIGYISADTATSVVIRTLVMENNRWHYGVGGAITALSDPEAEWQEILHKSRILKHLGGQ